MCCYTRMTRLFSLVNQFRQESLCKFNNFKTNNPSLFHLSNCGTFAVTASSLNEKCSSFQRAAIDRRSVSFGENLLDRSESLVRATVDRSIARRAFTYLQAIDPAGTEEAERAAERLTRRRESKHEKRKRRPEPCRNTCASRVEEIL